MSESISDTSTITAPTLVGMWVHDPINPTGTIRNFLHHDGRDETIEPNEAELAFVGRDRPVIEYGELTIVGLSLTVFIPFGPDHDAGKQWWVDAVNNRRTIVYRDNRGRFMFGSIVGGIAIADGRAGTALEVTLREVDYSETAA